jgi:hypothetical protein
MTQHVTLLIALTQLDIPVPISTQPLPTSILSTTTIRSINKEEASSGLLCKGKQRRRFLVRTARGYHPASHLRKSTSPELPTTRKKRDAKALLFVKSCKQTGAQRQSLSISLPHFFFSTKKKKTKTAKQETQFRVNPHNTTLRT